MAYAAGRWLAFDGAGARAFRDTIDYDEVARAPLASLRFMAGDHPPTVPFAYKLLGTGDGTRLAGQLIFSIGSWLGLAAAAAASLRVGWLRVVGFTAVLAFSLSANVIEWDAVLLSESISISLTAALVGAWLLFAGRTSALTVALALAVTAAWALTRDPHTYVLLLAAVVLAASLLVPRERMLRGVALGGVVAIAAVGLWSGSVGYKRWQYPLQNIIAQRIADDDDALNYFRDAGMPVTPRFLELSRRYRAGAEDPFTHPAGIEDPTRRREFLPFQHWLVDEGRGTYTRFLLTHPGYASDALSDLDHILLDPDVERYESERPGSGFGILGKVVVHARTRAAAGLPRGGAGARGGRRHEMGMAGHVDGAGLPDRGLAPVRGARLARRGAGDRPPRADRVDLPAAGHAAAGAHSDRPPRRW